MQQYQGKIAGRSMYDRCVIGIAALIWVLGLLTAGSDSIYMPWLNVAGAILFLAASLWLGRILPKLEMSGTTDLRQVFKNTRKTAKIPDQAYFSGNRTNLKVHTRYVLRRGSGLRGRIKIYAADI